VIAVDTNVLVRLLTGDEPKQEAAARSLFASETIWIAKLGSESMPPKTLFIRRVIDFHDQSHFLLVTPALVLGAEHFQLQVFSHFFRAANLDKVRLVVNV
jgi:hypothetical protein